MTKLLMRVILVLVALIAFIDICLAQSKDSTCLNYRKERAEYVSIHWDSLYNYYADFRKDTNGLKGLRLKYYEKYSVDIDGLDESKVIKLLGKPNHIGVVVFSNKKQKKILDYEMGSEIEKDDGKTQEGCNYKVSIYFINGKVDCPPENIGYFPEPWIKTGQF